jgi:transcriptional regulator with XRE-family HTH domain
MAVTELLDVAGAIGARVRACRADRGWTLDELAERSGVSRRMLVNVEQGRTNPSIATLLRISDVLGVGLPSLVDVAQPPALRVTRSGQAPVLWRGPSGGQAMLVAGSEPPDVVELWEWTLAPGECHASEAHTAGTRELLLVIEGQVELRVGQEVEVLATGDAVAFRGDRPHGYTNSAAAAEPARFGLTVFQPRVGRGGMP